jgi:hypothetical protein
MAEDRLPPPLYELRRTGPGCRAVVRSAGVPAGWKPAVQARMPVPLWEGHFPLGLRKEW